MVNPPPHQPQRGVREIYTLRFSLCANCQKEEQSSFRLGILSFNIILQTVCFPLKGWINSSFKMAREKYFFLKTPVIAISQWQRDCMCRSRLISPVVIMAVGAAQPRVISLLLYLLLFFPFPQTVWVEALDGSRCSAPRKDVGVSQWLYVGCYLWQTGVWARASLRFFLLN